jgi:aspartate/methionine/tyrosine aminotransferase
LISCGILDEAVASEALKNGSAVFNRNLTRIRENLAILDSWIREQAHVSYVKPQAGTTALIHYDFDIPSYDFCKQLLDKTGVFLTPGACFDEEYCFRIGYACATQTLKDGLQKLTEFTGGLSENSAIS